MLGDPQMVPGSSVDGKVENDGHSPAMGAVDKGLEVSKRPVFGAHRFEVLDTIRGDRASGVRSMRINRHQVNNVDPQRFDIVQSRCYAGEIAGRTIRTDMRLIHIDVPSIGDAVEGRSVLRGVLGKSKKRRENEQA